MNTRKEIFTSLALVNKALDAIAKDQQGYNYKFRGINQVMNAISPLFKKEEILVAKKVLDTKHEVRYSIETIERTDKQGIVTSTTKEKKERWCFYRCLYIFTSMKDGSTFEVEGYGEANDGDDKGTGKAISNAYKYVIFEMFNIPTEEQKDSDMDIKQVLTDVKESVEVQTTTSIDSPKIGNFVKVEAFGYKNDEAKAILIKLGFKNFKDNEGKWHTQNSYVKFDTLPEVPGITFKIV